MLDSMTKWIAGWKRKGWKTAGGDPVKNQDLVQALDAELGRHDVRWHWVRGHETGAAHAHKVLNDRADRLAVAAAAAARQEGRREHRVSSRGSSGEGAGRAPVDGRQSGGSEREAARSRSIGRLRRADDQEGQSIQATGSGGVLTGTTASSSRWR